MKVAKTLVPIFCDYASRPFKYIANTKTMQKICDKFEITPEKAIGATTIASIVGKDAIGCYMYVKQSLNNDKIPEEKRSFVAALDATNGILMILSQLLMYFTISSKKFQHKLFDKMFNKIFNSELREKYVSQMRAKPNFKSVSKDDLRKEFDKIKERSQDTFKFLTSLIASTTLAKRVIVPFIATPLAGWAKDKYFDKNAKKTNEKQNASDANNKLEGKEQSAENNVSPANLPEFKGNLLQKYITN